MNKACQPEIEIKKLGLRLRGDKGFPYFQEPPILCKIKLR